MLERKGGASGPACGCRLCGPGGLEEVDHRVDPGQRPVVCRPQLLLAFGEGARNHLDRVADVVEDDERVGVHEDSVVGRNAVARPRGELLEVTDHVIAEIPHGPSEEPRQALHVNGPVAAEELLQMAQGVTPVGEPADRAVLLDDDIAALHAEDRHDVRPEEAVAPPFFPSLHALQKEEMRALRQLHEGGDGGFRIGDDLPKDGDQVALLCQFRKCFEVRCIHGLFLFPGARHKKRP